MEYIKRSLLQETKMDIELIHKQYKFIYFVKDLLISPEFQIILSYRIQSRLFKTGRLGRLVAKILQLFTRAYTGCYIDYYAKIEGGVGIVHSVGVVIGDNALLKSGVQVYQNTTIGSGAQIDRITIVYPGAVVSGNVKIGQNCQIGANSVVLKDVPKNSKVVGVRIIPFEK